MGMYTELIFGASLKKETPKEVIDILKFMVGELEEKPQLPSHELFHTDRWDMLFTCGSYYFGFSSSNTFMKLDEIAGCYIISTRATLKNYDSEIEKFCDWIKPYINGGSGNNDIYAMSIYEEDEEYKIYKI